MSNRHTWNKWKNNPAKKQKIAPNKKGDIKEKQIEILEFLNNWNEKLSEWAQNRMKKT